MEDDQQHQQHGKLSKLWTRPKKPPSNHSSSCFHGSETIEDHNVNPTPIFVPAKTAPSSPRHFLSPSWFRSKASNPSSPAKKSPSSCRRRRHSADFRYDAASYNLNFDDGGGNESPIPRFSRLILTDVEPTPFFLSNKTDGVGSVAAKETTSTAAGQDSKQGESETDNRVEKPS